MNRLAVVAPLLLVSSAYAGPMYVAGVEPAVTFCGLSIDAEEPRIVSAKDGQCKWDINTLPSGPHIIVLETRYGPREHQSIVYGKPFKATFDKPPKYTPPAK